MSLFEYLEARKACHRSEERVASSSSWHVMWVTSWWQWLWTRNDFGSWVGWEQVSEAGGPPECPRLVCVTKASIFRALTEISFGQKSSDVIAGPPKQSSLVSICSKTWDKVLGPPVSLKAMSGRVCQRGTTDATRGLCVGTSRANLFATKTKKLFPLLNCNQERWIFIFIT